MIFRREIGWMVAAAYRLAGKRERTISELRAGKILPIVFHAASSEEVRAVFAALKRLGVLERVEVTFDDGWREFKDTIRVLEEFEKRCTLFIAPGEILRGDVWTRTLAILERQALYGLAAEERYARVGEVRERKLLDEREVREIARHPLVEIGNHTYTHLSATSRPAEEFLAEVERAGETLGEWVGKSPDKVAYPFGRGTDALDAELRKRGLVPYYTRQGLVDEQTRGQARNAVYEGMSLAENLGRIFMAWPKVGETL